MVSSMTLLENVSIVVWFIKWSPADGWLFVDGIMLGCVVSFPCSHSRNMFSCGEYLMMFVPFIFDTIRGVAVFLPP